MSGSRTLWATESATTRSPNPLGLLTFSSAFPFPGALETQSEDPPNHPVFAELAFWGLRLDLGKDCIQRHFDLRKPPEKKNNIIFQ